MKGILRDVDDKSLPKTARLGEMCIQGRKGHMVSYCSLIFRKTIPQFSVQEAGELNRQHTSDQGQGQSRDMFLEFMSWGC